MCFADSFAPVEESSAADWQSAKHQAGSLRDEFGSAYRCTFSTGHMNAEPRTPKFQYP
jgi:hypothetical protein